MFLRANKRFKDGKQHRSWSVVENRRVAGGPVRLGALTPTRDLTYVADTVAGFLAAALAPQAALGGTYNLGTGTEISIGDLAGLIAELIGGEAVIEQEAQRLRPAASEVERLLADASKAKAELGWKSTVDLRQGLAETIAWMRAREPGARAGEYAV